MNIRKVIKQTDESKWKIIDEAFFLPVSSPSLI